MFERWIVSGSVKLKRLALLWAYGRFEEKSKNRFSGNVQTGPDPLSDGSVSKCQKGDLIRREY